MESQLEGHIGGDFWPPLAIVLAGGVAGAPLIALVLVPAAYLLIGDKVEAETDQREASTDTVAGQKNDGLLQSASGGPKEATRIPKLKNRMLEE